MKRSKSVVLSLTAMAAATLTGCGTDDPPDYQAICVDPETDQRLDDDECDDSNDDYNGGGGGFFWFYMATRSSAPLPAVGQGFDRSAGTFDSRSLRANGSSYRLGGASKGGASSMSSYTKSTVKSGGFGGSGVKSYS